MGREDLKIISYNVRGLGNDKKRVAIFDILKHYKCESDICYMQETLAVGMMNRDGGVVV